MESSFNSILQREIVFLSFSRPQTGCWLCSHTVLSFRLCSIIEKLEELHYCSLAASVTPAQYQTLQTLSSILIFICPHAPAIHTDIDYCKQQRSWDGIYILADALFCSSLCRRTEAEISTSDTQTPKGADMLSYLAVAVKCSLWLALLTPPTCLPYENSCKLLPDPPQPHTHTQFPPPLSFGFDLA